MNAGLAILSPEAAAVWQRRVRGFVVGTSLVGSTIRTTLACLAMAAGIASLHSVADASGIASSSHTVLCSDATQFTHGSQLRDDAPAVSAASVVEGHCAGPTSAPSRRSYGSGLAGFWKALYHDAHHSPDALRGTCSPHASAVPATPTLLSLGMMLRL